MPKAFFPAFVAEADGSERRILLSGRNGWALANLVRSGVRGCTPIDVPGPRWSAYVHKLRHEFDLDIETIHESHGGTYPGTHARYVLRSKVRFPEAHTDKSTDGVTV